MITKEIFRRGIIIKADDVGTEGITGEMKVGLTSQRLHVYLEGALRTVVTQSQTQTLSNKTIDADTNTIANLEVDNLKAGVLNTSTTLATASDTQIPSALAVKTYVDDKAAAQNEASEISYAPAGNITATNVQAMGEELDSQIVDVQNNLDTHAADTTTHGVTGTLVGTTDTQTLDNKTINADTNTISNLEADNLKTGVLNTDVYLTGATNTQIPSALAVRTALLQGLADVQQNIDDEYIARLADVDAEEARAEAAEAALQTQVDTKVTKATSSTDNAIPRFDGTTGGIVQGSSVIISDTNAVSGITQLDVDNVRIDGNTVSTTNTSPLTIQPDTLSYIDLNGNVVLAQGKSFAATPVNNNTTGDNASVIVNGKNIRLTSASLTSIDKLIADVYGKEVTLINRTGNDITINNDAGVSSDSIYTGTGGSVVLKANAAFSFVYDGTTLRWNLIGGTGSGEGGGGGVTDVDTLLIQNFEQSVESDFFYSSSFELDTTEQINGEVSAKLTHDVLGNPNQYFQQSSIPVYPKFRGQDVTVSVVAKSTASLGNVTISFYDETNMAAIGTTEQINATSTLDTYSFGLAIPETCTSLSYTVTAISEDGSPVTYVDDIVFKLSEYSLLATSVEVPVITEWQSYTPTFSASLGSVSGIAVEYRQVGSNVELRGKFTTGTISASLATMSLPNGYTIDSSLSGVQVYGDYERDTATGAAYKKGVVNGTGGNGYVTFSTDDYTTARSPIVAQNADAIGSSIPVTLKNISIPIHGLSATESKSIALTQSGIVQEADSMVRVYGFTPALGSTNTTCVTLASGTSTSQGDALLYQDSAASGASFTAQVAGVYNFSFSSDIQTTGTAGVGFTLNSTQLTTSYSSINAANKLPAGYDSGGGGLNTVSTSVYLNVGDVVRLQAAGTFSGASTLYSQLVATYQGSLKQVNINSNSKITIPTSELRFEGASSRGSTATAIVKFDTLAKLRGDAFTVVNTAADGTYVQLKKAGKLSINFSTILASGQAFYITKNQSVLTAVPTVASEILVSGSADGNTRESASCSTFVSVGDIIRVSASAAPTANVSNIFELDFQEQDIQVSVSNTLPQFSESDSSIRVDTSNGYGSTGTRIRRFSNVNTSTGTDVVYTDSATNGASFTIMESGVYNISYSESFASAENLGVSRNSSSLTTDLNNLSASERLCMSTTPGANLAGTTSTSIYLNAGDILRPHTNNIGGTGIAARAQFTISKVGKPNVTGVDVTPFVNVPQPDYSELRFEGSSSRGSVATAIVKFDTIAKLRGDAFSITSTATDGTYVRMNKAGKLDLSFSTNSVGASFQITKNQSILTSLSNVASEILSYQSTDTSGNSSSSAISTFVNVGDVIRVAGNQTPTANNGNSFNFSFTGTSNQILTAPETFSTDTASLTYASSSQYTLATLANAPVGTYITFTYAASTNTRTQTTTRPTQTDADMNVNGILMYTRAYNATSTAGNPACIAIQIGKGLKGVTNSLYKSAGKTTAGATDYSVYGSTGGGITGISFKDYNEVTGILVIDAGYDVSGNSSVRSLVYSDATTATSGYLVVNASKNPALTGLNVVQPRIAIVKESQASGVVGGSFTAGAYLTRTLNTLEDPTGIVTGLASNRFTLPAGRYYIDATAPALNVDYHKAKIRNFTDSTDAIVGTSEYSRTSTPCQTHTFVRGFITITSEKQFELQHRCSVTGGTNALGGSAAFGDAETFGFVKIIKIK